MFHTGRMNAIRQVLAQKGAAPEDIMSNALFQSRWADVVKARGDELASLRATSKHHSEQHDIEDTDMAPEVMNVSLRGNKSIDRCAPDTSEYWDSFAAQLVRQYVKLAVEPKSSTGIVNEVKNSALNSEFVGEVNRSCIAITVDTELLQESASRPGDRKPPPNQTVIAKLLQGVMSARGGTANEDGLRIAPCDNDILFMCDGGRDSCKSALFCPQWVWGGAECLGLTP